MEAGKYKEAIAAFEAINGYKDSTTQITACKYNAAVALMDAGNIIEAYEAFIALNGYRDSADQANSIYVEYKKEKIQSAKVGDVIFLGAYEQDNNIYNGKEDIEWVVLEVKDGKALVISKYALDCRPYHTEFVDVTWEKCSLRQWLNQSFLSTVFSEEEIRILATVTVTTSKNPRYSHGADPGNATQDKVFLLSVDETKYLSTKVCYLTAYAKQKDRYPSDDGSCRWWLRTPGHNNKFVVEVKPDGSLIYANGDLITANYVAVRPAMWIYIGT